MQMMADGQKMIAGSADSPVGPSWSRRRSERPNHSEGATDPAEPDGPGDPCFFRTRREAFRKVPPPGVFDGLQPHLTNIDISIINP